MLIFSAAKISILPQMIQEPTKDYIPQTNQPSIFVQFLAIVGITIGLVIVFSFIAAGIILTVFGFKTLGDTFSFNTQNPHVGATLWILQIVSTTVPLFVAPVLFARFIVSDTATYLKPTFKFLPIFLLLIFTIMLFSSPVMEMLSNINQKLSLPAALKGLEDKLRAMELSAQKATEAMLNMKSIWALLWALFVVGLLTAIAEEFLFRGVIQTIFIRWTRNKHAAIWITAILFSAFHMEFFTFLPRVFLGAIFGYFVAYSGSIWTGVWGHFLNNGSAVLITYLFQHKAIKLDPDDQHVFNYPLYAVSIIIVLFLLFIYRNVAMGKKPELSN
jgi:membrane protease YdiL (CAAX protease family)